ncbi:MAG: ABC transporter ATP-binding protein [Phycisphaerales bacterium]
MSSDLSIRVENISKCYRIGLKDKIHDSIGSAVIDFFKSPVTNYRRYRSLYNFKDADTCMQSDKDILWALKDINLEIKKGQVLGIIGRNGAGKSTLLKVLSKITEPTSGKAEIHGRISSILEVGTGFHPELTGRENIYLNGAILGMKKREITGKFDEIVDFSGVEKFIDTPVKWYSSGMKVRLAFAVAANLQPEILIIDEVLAVGDAEFQNKCLDKMNNITESEGRTVLFVSHNMGAVIQLCPTSVLLNNGKVLSQGPSKDIVDKYLSTIFQPVDNLDLRETPVRSGDGRLRFIAARLQLENGECTASPIAGQAIDIVLDVECRQRLHKVKFVMTIFNQMGIAVTCFNVDAMGKCFNFPGGRGRVVCRIPKLPLPLGQYKIAVAASDDLGELDWIPTACIFNVHTSNFFDTSFSPSMRYSTALVEHSWEVIQ